MKSKVTLFLIFIVFNVNSQNKDKLFLLVESGFSEVNSRIKPQFGIGAEYFLSNRSSLSLRLKYFKNGIDYFRKGTSCGFGGFLCSSSKRLLYEGSVFKIPLNYKIELPFPNSRLNLTLNTGFGLSITLDEKFIELNNIEIETKKINPSFNLGCGLLYNLKSNFDIFTTIELFSGSPKTEEIGFIFGSKISTEESLLNIGIRYHLK